MHRELLKSKLKAFSAHFGISLSIFLILLYFVLTKWYPPPFFNTDGGWQGIRLITFVDLILGPTLTFVIFNPTKVRKLLLMDLTIIGIFQITALVWGVWVVHNERPYLAVFADGAFYTLPYYQLKETSLSKNEIEKFDADNKPVKVYVDIPKDKVKYFELLTKSVRTKPFHFMGDLYRPFNQDNLKHAARYNINMQEYLKGEKKSWIEEFKHFADSEPRINDMLFFSLHGRYGKYIVVFDKKMLRFRKVLDIPPPSIEEIVWGKEQAKKRQLRRQERKAASAAKHK